MNLKEALTAPHGAAGSGLTPGLITVVCDRDIRVTAVAGSWPGVGSPTVAGLRDFVHPDDHDTVGGVIAWLRTGRSLDHAVSVHVDAGRGWDEAALVAAAQGEDMVFTFVALVPDPAAATMGAVFAERDLADTLDEALFAFVDAPQPVWATVHHGRDADDRYSRVTATTGNDTFRRAVEAAVGGDLACPWDRVDDEDRIELLAADFPDGLKMAAKHAGIGAAVLFPIEGASVGDGGCLVVWAETPGVLDEPGTAQLIDRAMQAMALAFQIEAGREGVRRLATRDPLTGLLNRQTFFGHLRTAKTIRGCAVGCLDIDDFASINRTHGHSTGDDVLVETANRLRDAMRPGDIVARVSADEFAVVCAEVRSDEAAAAIAERINSVSDQPFVVGGTPTTLEMTLGMVVATDGLTGPQLFDRAEQAMVEAKGSTPGGWRLG